MPPDWLHHRSGRFPPRRSDLDPWQAIRPWPCLGRATTVRRAGSVVAPRPSYRVAPFEAKRGGRDSDGRATSARV